MRLGHTIFSALTALLCVSRLAAQSGKPEWRQMLPRSEYGKLEKVDQPDAWFEV
jgi:hypothetical protein